jgi:competence/damage-inducible protein CinA-like protein
MPAAEIITIGTELLLGEIVDTNSHYLARALRDQGIDLYRTTTVGDNPGRIAEAIQHSLERAEIVITTGGLGPTVDDPTRQAVALAAGVELEFREQLWEQVQARFRRFGRTPTENNRRQAYVPAGAIAVENPVGTAPAFIVEPSGRAVISLPGVPREMEHLMEHAIIPYLRRRFDLDSVIKARILHTAGVGESQIDERIGDLEQLSNPTVGLAAHSGQVDVRITAKASSLEEAEALIAGVEAQLRQRLGEWVYGADNETLERAAMQALQARGWRIAVVEAGLGGELIRRLANYAFEPFLAGEARPGSPEPDELLAWIQAYKQAHGAEVGLGAAISPSAESQQVFIALITPEGAQNFARPYGGPPAYAPRWAAHHSLDILRSLVKS